MSKFLISLRRLDQWFQQKKRILPWRDQPTTYRVWVSEIMLQQTQVVTVIPYFEKFIARFPTVEALAAAPQEDVLLHWAGLGYYSRARNLHRGAQQIVEKGKFPETREEWLEIPGVGNYTAGAILSIANNQPESILDGNVERVLSRVRCINRGKGDTHYKDRLWKLSAIFVKTAARWEIMPRNLNQALMELGATVCTPKKPLCWACPLQDLCRANGRNEAELFPPKKKPKEWIHVEENLHCVIHGKEWVLLRQRRKGEWREGLWDLLEQDPRSLFPHSQHLGQVETRHVVTRHKIQRTTEVWKIPASGTRRIGKAAEESSLGLRWVSIRDPDVAVGSALKKALQSVFERYESN